jgi:hypothetical protein
MICRRCGHEHGAGQCPVCGQPRPELLATQEQRRAYRQRLHVAAWVPLERAPELAAWLERADHRHVDGQRLLATYVEGNFRPFLKLWEAIADDPRCELLFNGRRRPYDRELWIPLMWIAAEA